MDKMDKLAAETSGARESRLQTSRCFYRIDRRDISFLKFILEAYDGVAVVTTADARRGIVGVSMAPGCQALVDSIITALVEAGEIKAEPVKDEKGLRGCREKTCASFT